VKKLEHFERKKEFAVFCPVGQASFDEVSELISRAVLRCRKEKTEELLIDSTGVPTSARWMCLNDSSSPNESLRMQNHRSR